MSMLRRLPFLCIALAPLAAVAQHSALPESATSAPAEAKQFDFLLGEWQLEVRPKVSGLVAMIHGSPKLVGTWKAWRVLDGLGVEDEMRIVDASGNPVSLNRGMRIYSRSDARWKISGIDAYHGRSSEASGSWQGNEMRIEGHFIEGDGKTVLTRTRYYDIGADAFHMQQDRSMDNGQTWDEAALTVDAKRTAATAAP